MSAKLFLAEEFFYTLPMCSVQQNGSKSSRLCYCNTESRSEELVGRYKVMMGILMALRHALKSPSWNSRQCLPLAVDPTEIPLISHFYCHALKALLLLHKRSCHADFNR